MRGMGGRRGEQERVLQQIRAIDFFPGVVRLSTLDYEMHFSLLSALAKDYVPVVCIHSEIAKHSRDQPLLYYYSIDQLVLLLERPATTILLLKRPATTTTRETSHSIEDP